MHVPLALADHDTLAVPDGYELIEGQLVEKKMGAKSSWTGSRLVIRLGTFCEANGLGSVWAGDTAYRCFANPRLVRKPDVSFIRRDRLPDEDLPDGELRLAPDLAVEVVSPNDTVYELDAKIEEYFTAKVRLVWVINPNARIAIIHRLDGSMSKVRESQELTGDDVVPGFRCLLSACLPPRPVEAVADKQDGPAG